MPWSACTHAPSQVRTGAIRGGRWVVAHRSVGVLGTAVVAAWVSEIGWGAATLAGSSTPSSSWLWALLDDGARLAVGAAAVAASLTASTLTVAAAATAALVAGRGGGVVSLSVELVVGEPGAMAYDPCG